MYCKSVASHCLGAQIALMIQIVTKSEISLMLGLVGELEVQKMYIRDANMATFIFK